MSVGLAGLGALVAIAASLSLWWFAAGAGALLVWLHLQSPRAEDRRRTPPCLRLSTATILSLATYALLVSIALLTVRAAVGLLELPVAPIEQAGLAPGMQRASVGYYDKSELRLALLELLVLTVAFTIVSVRLANQWVRQRSKPLAMHPLTAAFAFVLYFASVRLPPYRIDIDDWDPLWSFRLSALSLGAVATLCNLAAGMASFTLLRRLTGSRAVALLGASYLLLEATATHADRLTPAPAHVALAMLLLYLSLRYRAERKWPALLFGLVAGIVVHGVLTSSSAGRPGLEPPLTFVPLLVPVLLLLALTSRKRGGFRQWTTRRIFAGASLLCAVPYAFLAATRADPAATYALQWVLLPAAALALYGAIRAISLSGGFGMPRRFRAAFSLGMTTLLLVACFDLFFPIDRLNRAIARYATAYEAERATWYRQCAAGLACDPGAKPSLAYYVRHASRGP